MSYGVRAFYGTLFQSLSLTVVGTSIKGQTHMFNRVLIWFLLLSSAAFAGVTVSSPTSGVTTASPIHVVAQATPSSSANHITFMRIYLDHPSVYGAAVKAIDTSVTAAAGSRSMTVQAWDSAGLVY